MIIISDNFLGKSTFFTKKVSNNMHKINALYLAYLKDSRVVISAMVKNQNGELYLVVN